MKYFYPGFMLLISMLVISCGQKKQDSKAESAKDHQFKLTQQWATDSTLITCESVLYDPDQDILYVSNINGQPLEKNGEGFISKVKTTGEIEDLKWVTGLNAPKGSGIWQGKLYVTDIDELVEIDIDDEDVSHRYPAANAIFLNDITVDDSGNVYISDMSEENNVIYRFRDGELAVWLQDEQIISPNGLFYENGKLMVGTSTGILFGVDVATKAITTLAKTGFGIDGVQGDGEGNYFVSDWSGLTAVVTASGAIQVLMNTTDKKINSADIEYIPEKKLLLSPTFFDNRVIGYAVE